METFSYRFNRKKYEKLLKYIETYNYISIIDCFKELYKRYLNKIIEDISVF